MLIFQLVRNSIELLIVRTLVIMTLIPKCEEATVSKQKSNWSFVLSLHVFLTSSVPLSLLSACSCCVFLFVLYCDPGTAVRLRHVIVLWIMRRGAVTIMFNASSCSFFFFYPFTSISWCQLCTKVSMTSPKTKIEHLMFRKSHIILSSPNHENDKFHFTGDDTNETRPTHSSEHKAAWYP